MLLENEEEIWGFGVSAELFSWFELKENTFIFSDIHHLLFTLVQSLTIILTILTMLTDFKF